MALFRHAPVYKKIVSEEIEAARRCDVWVQHAHGACGGASRIGETLAAEFLLLLVQIFECLARHHRLATHFERSRESRFFEGRQINAQRDRADGLGIRCDVFAGGPVAPRDSAHKYPLLIKQRHAQAVELVLADVVDFFTPDQLADAPVEGLEFLERECIVEADHRRLVPNSLGACAGRATNALCGRIRRYQLRVLGFQLLQLIEQTVKSSVGDLGIVLDVIKIFVTPNFIAQALDFFCCVTALGHVTPVRLGNTSGMPAVKTAGYYTMRVRFSRMAQTACPTESKTRF